MILLWHAVKETKAVFGCRERVPLFFEDKQIL